MKKVSKWVGFCALFVFIIIGSIGSCNNNGGNGNFVEFRSDVPSDIPL